MATIINSETTENNKMIYSILLDYEELLRLQGHIKNIHVFSENTVETKSQLSARGTNKSAKYFLIPKGLRKNADFPNKASCLRTETDSKIIFVYVMDEVMF